MATFKICVFKNKKRQDGKYPVSIRVYWNKQISYITTEYKVTDKQINQARKKFELKDVFIINELNRRIANYEELKSKKLGNKIYLYTAKELANYFVKETAPSLANSIDFIEFARGYIKKVNNQGRTSSANNMIRVVNAMIDFSNGREKVYVSEITSKFLQHFEEFLRSPRTMKRINQLGKSVTIKRPGVSDVTIFNYMTDIRVLFNAALNEFNDEDKGDIRIIHYPFRKYKLKPRPETAKRNLTLEQVQAIVKLSDDKLKFDRGRLARDTFLLSFYFIGMNFTDLYYADRIVDGRLEYERKKTSGRRQDRAFISIKIQPEAFELVEKYQDKTGKRVFNFYQRYSTPHIFSSGVNKGLKQVADACKIPELTTYYARHTWATFARNKCGVSKDDVSLALNHVDSASRVTDTYIEKDWSIIDNANRAVLDYI